MDTVNKEIICFSLMDFSKSGGGVIRVSGILNALAERGVDITIYNTSNEIKELNQAKVIELPESFKNIQKREFQFLLTYGGSSMVDTIYKELYADAKRIFENINQPILFFEHLDISIGYWLYSSGIINSYYTDVHGISPIEFDLNETNSISKSVVNKAKKVSVIKLEKQIYGNSSLIIYSSSGVKKYMQKLYDLEPNKGLVVDESINSLLLAQTIDEELKKQIINEFKIEEGETVILFAGSFKEFGGIADLVKAYILLRKEYELSSRLLLIGDGQLYDFCQKMVQASGFEDEIVFLGRRPYDKLKTFHSLADIIVCPDKDTLYSQILPHIKYFDSLASGDIVINGLFEFTDEINPNEKYSLDFIPSSVQSLKDTLLRAIINKKELASKYAEASEEAKQVFNYNKSVEKLYNFLVTT